MAKMWRRTLREPDEDEDEDDDVYERGRYRRPVIEARHYDRSVLDEFADYEDDDEEDRAHVDELLEKVKKGKYKPKPGDHWTLHVAYSLIENRGR